VRIEKKESDKYCTYSRKKTQVLGEKGERPRTREKSLEERIFYRI